MILICSVLTTRLPSSLEAAAAWEQLSHWLFARGRRGCPLPLHEHHPELDAVAEQIRAAGRRAHTVAADLAHLRGPRSWLVRPSAGSSDIVVNNVGGTMPNTLSTSIKRPRGRLAFNVGTAHTR